MIMVENINKILEEFGASISLPNLKLNADNICVLCLDGQQNIQLNFDEDHESLDFFTEVGSVPENNSERCCDCLLKSNAEWSLTQGMTLSKKCNQQTIVLGYQLPMLNLSEKLFERALECFINQMDLWKEYMQKMGQGELPDALAEL